ncbi:hypothetical protein OSC27_04035 [Microbacterium sp. STN6]|uniref:hypothetical protein n=1 Tax=Microbacterium sp. STN6 TaxID=2995588 RepID=UPI0022608A36|nr:hypothetical protein [Microbacterium sp. STN6]MCX7521446.1 hypothetical protein [Microbacterium sp. STN6]
MTQAILLGLLVVAACVWIGGWVSLVVIARSTTATLSREARVAFFRHFGRRYGIVATIALLVAFASGLALLLGAPWSALSTAMVVLCAVLTVGLGVGVIQARRMTRLRRAAASAPLDDGFATRIRRGARWALVLRAGIGVLSLAVLVLAVIASTA